MKPIEFRGKRKDNGKWVYGYYVYDGVSGKSFIISEIEETEKEGLARVLMYEVIPETVGQYTGLKDRNGKKIFKGDVVKKTPYNLVVTFEDGAYIIKEPTGFGQTRRHLYHVATDIEIIGNLYKNLELLKEQK